MFQRPKNIREIIQDKITLFHTRKNIREIIQEKITLFHTRKKELQTLKLNEIVPEKEVFR